MAATKAKGGNGIIRAISSSSVKKIVAGQLITDAAAVVRELLENACDGGATQVTITLSSSLDNIEVKDNGKGIATDGRHLLLSANATSKISNFEDIYSDDTDHSAYGFRGEALHLMGQACHELIITTRTSSETHAERIRVLDGERQADIEKCVAPVGTSVRMVGLFASIPVRLKQLQANIKKEQQNIERLCYVYALAHPSLRLSCGMKPKMNKAAASDVAATIKSLFSTTLFNQLCAVKWRSDDGQFDISGYWPSRDAKCDVKDVTRGRVNDRMFLFVNGRPANDTSIERAITQCFRTHSSATNVSSRYPFVVLDIRVPRAQYDVNLSPDKRDFLFRGKDILKGHIVTALESSIGVELGSTAELNKRAPRGKVMDNGEKKDDNDNDDTLAAMATATDEIIDNNTDNDSHDIRLNHNDTANAPVFRVKSEMSIKRESKGSNHTNNGSIDDNDNDNDNGDGGANDDNDDGDTRVNDMSNRKTTTAGARLILEESPATGLRQSKLSLSSKRPSQPNASPSASSSSSSSASSAARDDDDNDNGDDDVVVATTPKKRAVTTKGGDRPIAAKIHDAATTPTKRSAAERKRAADDIASSTRVDVPESRKRKNKANTPTDDGNNDGDTNNDGNSKSNDKTKSRNRSETQPTVTTDIENDDGDDDLGESLSMLEELVRWDLPMALTKFKSHVIQHVATPTAPSDDRVGSVQLLGVLDGGVNYVVQEASSSLAVAATRETKQGLTNASDRANEEKLPSHVRHWLKSLHVINRARLEERLCYDRLARSLELPMSELDEPVTLDDSLSISATRRDELVILLTADQKAKDDGRPSVSSSDINATNHLSITRAFTLCGFKLRVRTVTADNTKHIDILAVPKDQAITITEFVDLVGRLLSSSYVRASLADASLLPCHIPANDIHVYRADVMLRQFRDEASRLAASAAKQVRALPRDKLKRLLQSVINGGQCGTGEALHNARCSCQPAQPILMPLPTTIVPVK